MTTQSKPQKRVKLFTDVTIRNLNPESKRVIWWAKGMPGFGVRISTKGTKTFIYNYYNRDQNRYRTKTYGVYPKVVVAEARTQYSLDKEKLLKGEDPATDQVEANQALKEVPTVNDLIKEWENYGRLLGFKDYRNKVSTVQRDLGRLYGNYRADKITKGHIVRINNEILERGSPGAARESWQNIRTMFYFGMDRFDGILENPASKVKAPAPKGSCDRVLSPQEIFKFWHGIKNTEMNPIVRGALKMILVTLQRGSEVRNAEWVHISEQESSWEIPNPKNKVFHRVALNKYALEIVEEMKSHTSGSPLIFGISRYHKSKATPDRKDLTVMYHGTLSENTRDNCLQWGCNHFTPHDLRRTAATILTGVGIPRFFIKMALNHVDDDGVTTVYDRYAYDYEKKKVAEIWQLVLEKIIQSEEANGVPSVLELRELVKEQGMFHS